MKSYIRYDKITGAIKSTGTCQDHMVILQGTATHDSIEGEADANTQYIDVATETIIARPVGTLATDKATVASPAEILTISGIIDGDVIDVLLDGTLILSFPYTAADAELTFMTAGAYIIRAKPAVKLPNEVLVNVT